MLCAVYTRAHVQGPNESRLTITGGEDQGLVSSDEVFEKSRQIVPIALLVRP